MLLKSFPCPQENPRTERDERRWGGTGKGEMGISGTRRRAMRVQEEDVTMHDVILPYLRKDLIESTSIQSFLDEGLSQLRDLRGQNISS
jgi:hypothetical protein